MDAYGRAMAQVLPYPRMHFQVWNRDGSLVMDYPAPGSSKSEADAEQRQFMLSPSAGGTQTLGMDSGARIWAKATLPRWRDAGLSLALSVPEVDLNERVDGPFKRALAGLYGTSAVTRIG